MQKKPTIWLSIHKWSYGPTGADAVVDVLRLYRRVLEGHEREVNVHQDYRLCDFCTILATDLDTKVYYE